MIFQLAKRLAPHGCIFWQNLIKLRAKQQIHVSFSIKYCTFLPKHKISCQVELNSLIVECTAHDFKVMLEDMKPKSWLKSVSAFANGLHGSLFFGVDNDGVVKGFDDVQYVSETISSKIRDYMDPLPVTV
jgi:hypothetical protein